MRFRIGEDVYEWDDTTLTVAEARVIKKNTGMGLRSFTNGLNDVDPDAIAAMIFLARRRKGEAVRWQDMDDIDLGSFDMLPDEEPSEEDNCVAGDEEVPPTVPEPETTPDSNDGTTPTNDETNTSSPSLSTSVASSPQS